MISERTLSEVEYFGKKKLDLLVREMIARQNVREANETLFFVKNKVCLDYCVDLSETDNYGNKYLYVWLDNKNKSIYIGQGNLGRIIEKHTNIVNAENESEKYEVYLLAKDANGISIKRVEESLIVYACLMNIKLINSRDIIAEEDVKEFRKKYSENTSGQGEIKFPFSINVYYKDYRAVFDAFDRFASDKLFVDRHTEFSTVDFEYSNYSPPHEYAPHWSTVKTWTINGVTKTISEWTEEYGISYTTVKNRMEKYNIPLEKAISLPKARSHTGYGTALEQWQRAGLM